MRRLITTAAVASLFAAPLVARGVSDGSLKGSYVEARTAEVFTGGCIMNGEAATTGREALLAWKVDRGSFDGVPLNGLAVVAAIAGDTNLGVREIGGDVAHTKSAVFVDERADAAQRAALVSMAQQLANGVVGTVLEVVGVTSSTASSARYSRSLPRRSSSSTRERRSAWRRNHST